MGRQGALTAEAIWTSSMTSDKAVTGGKGGNGRRQGVGGEGRGEGQDGGQKGTMWEEVAGERGAQEEKRLWQEGQRSEGQR